MPTDSLRSICADIISNTADDVLDADVLLSERWTALIDGEWILRSSDDLEERCADGDREAEIIELEAKLIDREADIDDLKAQLREVRDARTKAEAELAELRRCIREAASTANRFSLRLSEIADDAS